MILCSISGQQSIVKRLQQFPVKLRRKALMRAAKASMRPILVAAKGDAPRASGALRKSIKLRVIKGKRSSQWVGVRVASSDKWFTGETYYGAFQEFGWHVGKRTAEIRHSHGDSSKDTRPLIPGKHYMENAYKMNADEAMRTFIAIMPGEIDKVVSELKVK